MTSIKLELKGGSNDENLMKKWDKLNQISDSIIRINQINQEPPNSLKLFTIPEGTILYHGSIDKASFNPYQIVLGEDTLVSYFTASKKLSADYILGCAKYPSKTGYIHKFRVKKDITNILIISPYEKQKNWDEKFIENKFCFKKKDSDVSSSLTQPLYLNGIGFFYASDSQKTLLDIDLSKTMNSNGTTSEFALCNPNKWLDYISTQRCIGTRQLSDEHNFTKIN